MSRCTDLFHSNRSVPTFCHGSCGKLEVWSSGGLEWSGPGVVCFRHLLQFFTASYIQLSGQPVPPHRMLGPLSALLNRLMSLMELVDHTAAKCTCNHVGRSFMPTALVSSCAYIHVSCHKESLFHASMITLLQHSSYI